jgi:hypothetical protein
VPQSGDALMLIDKQDSIEIESDQHSDVPWRIFGFGGSSA